MAVDVGKLNGYVVFGSVKIEASKLDGYVVHKPIEEMQASGVSVYSVLEPTDPDGNRTSKLTVYAVLLYTDPSAGGFGFVSVMN